MINEEAGISKKTQEEADAIINEVKKRIKKPIKFENEYFIEIGSILPIYKFTMKTNKNFFFNEYVERIRVTLVSYDLLKINHGERYTDIDKIINAIEGLNQRYVQALKMVEVMIVVRMDGPVMKILSDAGIIAHELQHVYQKMSGGLNNNVLHSKAIEKINGAKEISDFYYGIYFYNNNEITANVNRLYKSLSDNKVKSIEDALNSDTYNKFKEIIEAIDKSIDKVSSSTEYKNVVENDFGKSFQYLENYLRKGKSVFLTKLQKAIYYYYLNNVPSGVNESGVWNEIQTKRMINENTMTRIFREFF